MMGADGSNLCNLTNNEAYDAHPAWSPDGEKILFYSQRNGYGEIWVMDADCSNEPDNLTENAATDTEPAWSPDGQHIVFVSDREGNWDIYVMDADGSNIRPLTTNPGDDRNPTWVQ